MASKKSSNGNGSITLAKLFEYVEDNNITIDSKLNEIKFEVQKNRTEVLEKLITMTSEIKERLVKIEAQPAHENFQRQFCPNTKDIEELREVGSKNLKEYILMHQSEHKAIFSKIDELVDAMGNLNDKWELRTRELVGMYEKKLDERDKRARKALWAGIGAIVVIAIPAVAEILITLLG